MDSMSGIFNPPFSKEFINAFRLTYSLPFQTNEYSRLLIILMKSFLVEIRDARYRIFGLANDLITCILLWQTDAITVRTDARTVQTHARTDRTDARTVRTDVKTVRTDARTVRTDARTIQMDVAITLNGCQNRSNGWANRSNGLSNALNGIF